MNETEKKEMKKSEDTEEAEEKKIEEILIPEKEEVIDERAIKKVFKELTKEERLIKKIEEDAKEKVSSWKPKTQLGKIVKEEKIKDIDEIFDKGLKIKEAEIVDSLLNLRFALIKIGQSKGKFGGGKRREWRQTQKKTAEGNIPTFGALAIVGDEKGHVGVGYGKAKETVPARGKAIRNAKLNLIRIKRGCGSFDCGCKENHSIPLKVDGKCGSVKVILMPAPKGTGLVSDDECKKLFRLAGIKDVYSRSFGQTRTKMNMIMACLNALKKISDIKNP